MPPNDPVKIPEDGKLPKLLNLLISLVSPDIIISCEFTDIFPPIPADPLELLIFEPPSITSNGVKIEISPGAPDISIPVIAKELLAIELGLSEELKELLGFNSERRSVAVTVISPALAFSFVVEMILLFESSMTLAVIVTAPPGWVRVKVVISD
ncbi:MAG: hypothetical protein OEZ57_10970 [Nitrospirota bacterium]|nr:hypothetical protein [Nitrospirota bacterium]